MMWTFNKVCSDCKYCVDSICTHPNGMYCEHCELWTPKRDGKGEGE